MKDKREREQSREELATMGQAADVLLSSPVVMSFFSRKERELFDRFCSLRPNSDMGEMAEIIHENNILAELLSSMQTLRQLNRQSGLRTDAEEGVENDKGEKHEGRGEREILLGIGNDEL